MPTIKLATNKANDIIELSIRLSQTFQYNSYMSVDSDGYKSFLKEGDVFYRVTNNKRKFSLIAFDKEQAKELVTSLCVFNIDTATLNNTEDLI